MWPWDLIHDLKHQIKRYQEREVYLEKWNERYQRLYIEKCRDLQAAHKGIRRLVEKNANLRKQANLLKQDDTCRERSEGR